MKQLHQMRELRLLANAGLRPRENRYVVSTDALSFREFFPSLKESSK